MLPSAEDVNTVAWFTSDAFRTNFSGWRVQFANVPRKPDSSLSPMDYALKFGPDNEMLFSLVCPSTCLPHARMAACCRSGVILPVCAGDTAGTVGFRVTGVQALPVACK
jgi:hypothetical protein